MNIIGHNAPERLGGQDRFKALVSFPKRGPIPPTSRGRIGILKKVNQDDKLRSLEPTHTAKESRTMYYRINFYCSVFCSRGGGR